MRKGLIIFSLIGALCNLAKADITVKVSSGVDQKEFEVESAYISDLVKSRMERPAPLHNTYTAENGSFVIKNMPNEGARYIIPGEGRDYIALYALPKDNLTVTIENLAPLTYKVNGSTLMRDIDKLDKQSEEIMKSYTLLSKSEPRNEDALQAVSDSYDKLFLDYISNNPEADAAVYAILHLDGEQFMNAFNTATDKVKSHFMYPLLEQQKKYVERKMIADQRKAALQSGMVDAPNFTYKNIDGQDISLSDFKGKWVVIDFWGTWCPWCIKGFPALKEAYAKYQPQLEVVGVACNDKYEAWVKGVEKYSLPWVNVYNPVDGGGPILEEYAVEGFPTKVIVNPEGKIVNITSGEDPKFFDILGSMIK